MDNRIKHRKHAEQLEQQSAERNAAKALGNDADFRRLLSEHAQENRRYEEERNAAQMGLQYFAKESDPRWKYLSHADSAWSFPSPVWSIGSSGD
jgi:hypothetical protein